MVDFMLIIFVLEEVFGGSFGDLVGLFNFKVIIDCFLELMFDYFFWVLVCFVLIIWVVVS